MSAAAYWLAGVFLPLFPLSMAFNGLFNRVRNAPLRAVLLLAWPQIGLGLGLTAGVPVPHWYVPLALFTSALYAFRALGVREVGQWVGYLATSAWALLWLALFNGTDLQTVRLYAFGFSLPLAMLAVLGSVLQQRFGAAYTGLYGGLAQMLPRLAGVLVGVVLAIIAAPLFPAFFAMLATVVAATPRMPLAAVAVGGIWLLWSWAGVRLLQGLIVGPADDSRVVDISLTSTLAYTAVLVLLFFSGLYVGGGLL